MSYQLDKDFNLADYAIGETSRPEQMAMERVNRQPKPQPNRQPNRRSSSYLWIAIFITMLIAVVLPIILFFVGGGNDNVFSSTPEGGTTNIMGERSLALHGGDLILEDVGDNTSHLRMGGGSLHMDAASIDGATGDGTFYLLNVSTIKSTGSVKVVTPALEPVNDVSLGTATNNFKNVYASGVLQATGNDPLDLGSNAHPVRLLKAEAVQVEEPSFTHAAGIAGLTVEMENPAPATLALDAVLALTPKTSQHETGRLSHMLLVEDIEASAGVIPGLGDLIRSVEGRKMVVMNDVIVLLVNAIKEMKATYHP